MNAMPTCRLLLSLAGVALLASACSRQPAVRGGAAEPPLAVRTEVVKRESMERLILVSGSLLGQDESVLSVKVPGRLQHLAVDLGSAVRAGDLIAELDASDYQLRVDQARALLEQARVRLGLPLAGDDDEAVAENTSTVKQAKAVLVERERELERLSSLSKQGIASQAELEVSQSAHLVALSKYEDALEEIRTRRAVLAQRRAEFNIAAKQLADTRMLAPFDGAVQQRIANLGEYLALGAPVVKLVRTDPLRLRVEVPEREAPRIRAGQAVRVTVEGDTNTYQGAVRRLSPAITERSRVLVVEADVPSNGVLRPGAFARARIVTDGAMPALCISVRALVTFAGIEKVFVVAAGRAVESLITTGDRVGDRVEVLTGLREGDRVVLQPGGLQTGRAVTLAN